MCALPACCERFARYHADPVTFLKDHAGLPLDSIVTDDSGAAVTVTARGLYLTRNLTVQTDGGKVLDPRSGLLPIDWRHDTYLGGFALSAAEVMRWQQHKVTVLDVAAGLSVFPTEARALGIDVDAVDAEVGDGHPAFARVAQWLGGGYRAHLEFLNCLSQHSGDARYAMNADESMLLERLLDGAATVVGDYPQCDKRMRGDATVLRGVPSDHYDVVLCGWLMVHLDEADERAAIEAMARVTQPGGEIRVVAGYGGDAAARWRAWYGADEMGKGNKRVRPTAASSGDLLVLGVTTASG